MCALVIGIGSTEPAAESVASVLDGLQPADANEYDGTRRQLAELIVGPSMLGEHRLIILQVDDPNENGRIDGRWYPPRVRETDCQITVDSAPIPTATAGFIPGSPSDLLDSNQLAVQMDAMEADHQIAISVNIFDEPQQRDDYAAVLAEVYSSAFAIDSALQDALIDQYSIGERILLSVSIGRAGPAAFGSDDPVDPQLAYRAIDSEIAQLEAATLP